MVKALYGTWSSPIKADTLTSVGEKFSDVIVDPITNASYAIKALPDEGGRNVLINLTTDQRITEGNFSVKTSVHEYGGAPAIAYGNVIYFSNAEDGVVYKLNVANPSQVEPITSPIPGSKPNFPIHRFANFNVNPNYPHILAAILEDHTVDLPSKVVNKLVLIDTQTKSVRDLVSGSDFYSSPKFSPDGQFIAWQQWNHPYMSWQASEIHIANFVPEGDGTFVLHNRTHVAGSGDGSAVYPLWIDEKTIAYSSDVSGYQNPYVYDIVKKVGRPVLDEATLEFAPPGWSFGMFPHAVISPQGDFGLWSFSKDGRDHLGVLKYRTGTSALNLVPLEYEGEIVSIGNLRLSSISPDGRQAKVLFMGAKRTATAVPMEITIDLGPLLGLDTGDKQLGPLKASLRGFVRSASTYEHLLPYLSPPQPKTLVTPDGAPLHVVYYAPYNPDYEGSSVSGEKPPCIIDVHGGPTALSEQSLSWGKQFFTSRGWAWLDVNYGGSSGYGKVYRDRLNKNWGIVDVNDCIDAASILATEHNLTDLSRTVIRGGSAGGFTALGAVSFSKNPRAFAAATSLYGVADLKQLLSDTHKFESHYLIGLVGGTVEQVPQVYKERSAVEHADKISVPLLILQGEDDRVVPKAQAESIVKVIRERHGDVEDKFYPGEGHGWRKKETIIDAIGRELAFYNRVLKIASPQE